MDELDALFPQPVTVTMHGGRKVQVGPLRFLQWRPVMRALGPALERLLANDLKAALEHDATVLDGLAAATGEDRASLDTLYPDEVLALLAALVEQNRDFFDRAVLPRMVALLRGFVAAPQRPAESADLSPGLPGADTASTTSAD